MPVIIRLRSFCHLSLLSKNLKVRIYKTVILPVVLYGCETWTLTLREEHRLRVFENKVLRKIFGTKRDEVTGEWRKLHNTELHALYSSPDIIRNIKSRRLRWAGHAARMDESRNAYRVGRYGNGAEGKRFSAVLFAPRFERSIKFINLNTSINVGGQGPEQRDHKNAAKQHTAFTTLGSCNTIHKISLGFHFHYGNPRVPMENNRRILLPKKLKFRIHKTVILPVVLYGFQTYTPTLREEQRLRLFENKVLRKICASKRDEVTGEWRKLHNAELHALYSSPDIIRNIKSRRLRWAGHVARMLVGKPEGKRPLERPRRRWEDNIKIDLRKNVSKLMVKNLGMRSRNEEKQKSSTEHGSIHHYGVMVSVSDCEKATQRAYQREFGVRNPPKRNTILGLVNKLETTGSLVSEKGKHRSSRLPTVVVDTVNTAECRLIFMEFVEQLDDVELSQGYFQQDGATCHTSNESMELTASFFDDRIISRNLWPPRSPDLTMPDFFLWGYLKDRVYATRPQTLDDLKHNITQEIQAIDNRVLQRVASKWNDVFSCALCRMEDIFNICYRGK
ncbi:hypothetical protein ANN_05800 [Periplaneta americana]|uniref:DUF4817 domain-containing protein n=1 Tax=Periplaneta americana TaxID=6978 RepID=A0ABQ8TBT5_PERAM|nr:hypothetical protein ANN_05800 [Periplaneta americana]